MKVIQQEDNALFTRIDVLPWPDEPFSARVTAHLQKKDPATWQPDGTVTVRYEQNVVDVQTAREWASAILRACDIADQLERGETIVLEDEGSAPLEEQR